MVINKKKIFFYLFGATALTLTLVGLKRVFNKSDNSIQLPDSDYKMTFSKFKSKDEKNDGVIFEYSFKNQSSAKKIENLSKQSFIIFNKYKIDVDSISNRPFFEITIKDLKDPNIITKSSIRV